MPARPTITLCDARFFDDAGVDQIPCYAGGPHLRQTEAVCDLDAGRAPLDKKMAQHQATMRAPKR
jgi:hypothetical protein